MKIRCIVCPSCLCKLSVVHSSESLFTLFQQLGKKSYVARVNKFLIVLRRDWIFSFDVYTIFVHRVFTSRTSPRSPLALILNCQMIMTKVIRFIESQVELHKKTLVSLRKQSL